MTDVRRTGTTPIGTPSPRAARPVDGAPATGATSGARTGLWAGVVLTALAGAAIVYVAVKVRQAVAKWRTPAPVDEGEFSARPAAGTVQLNPGVDKTEALAKLEVGMQSLASANTIIDERLRDLPRDDPSAAEELAGLEKAKATLQSYVKAMGTMGQNLDPSFVPSPPAKRFSSIQSALEHGLRASQALLHQVSKADGAHYPDLLAIENGVWGVLESQFGVTDLNVVDEAREEGAIAEYQTQAFLGKPITEAQFARVDAPSTMDLAGLVKAYDEQMAALPAAPAPAALDTLEAVRDELQRDWTVTSEYLGETRASELKEAFKALGGDELNLARAEDKLTALDLKTPLMPRLDKLIAALGALKGDPPKPEVEAALTPLNRLRGRVEAFIAPPSTLAS